MGREASGSGERGGPGFTRPAAAGAAANQYANTGKTGTDTGHRHGRRHRALTER